MWPFKRYVTWRIQTDFSKLTPAYNFFFGRTLQKKCKLSNTMKLTEKRKHFSEVELTFSNGRRRILVHTVRRLYCRSRKLQYAFKLLQSKWNVPSSRSYTFVRSFKFYWIHYQKIHGSYVLDKWIKTNPTVFQIDFFIYDELLLGQHTTVSLCTLRTSNIQLNCLTFLVRYVEEADTSLCWAIIIFQCFVRKIHSHLQWSIAGNINKPCTVWLHI
jgi:hypothetical protein